MAAFTNQVVSISNSDAEGGIALDKAQADDLAEVILNGWDHRLAPEVVNVLRGHPRSGPRRVSTLYGGK